MSEDRHMFVFSQASRHSQWVVHRSRNMAVRGVHLAGIMVALLVLLGLAAMNQQTMGSNQSVPRQSLSIPFKRIHNPRMSHHYLTHFTRQHQSSLRAARNPFDGMMMMRLQA